MPVLKEELSGREKEILALIADGASDREIAGKLYLSINTVKWHNRQIYAKLDVSSRTQAAAQVSELGLLEKEPSTPEPSISIKNHNLPVQISSFVGREKELNEIKKLLKTNRLLTLTGPGGVGKTRLALEVAAELIDEDIYKDGVFFVELASLTNPEQIGNVILDALELSSGPGQSVLESLVNFLRTKNILLVIDNFEHLLEGAVFIKDLLKSAPEFSILSTSREALNLSGEFIFQVSPLMVPDPAEIKAQVSLEDFASIELFVTRVLAVNTKFDPAGEDLAIVAEICARLDGLPLAIELAAARMNLFSLQSLLDRLQDCFQILTESPRDAPSRHQTLEEAIDWSYQMLSPEEQILFRRLGVFQGSRSMDAVQEVCCFDLELDELDGLDSLLSKNLIKQKIGMDRDPLFIMLETIQEFAKERLHESGELQQIQSRHTRFFVELVEQVQYSFRGGPDAIYWISKLQEDYENIRIIFDRSLDRGEVEFGLRLVGGLNDFWVCANRAQEGLPWVEWALEHVRSTSLPIQAGIYAAAGFMSNWFRDYQKSLDYYQEAIDCYHKLGNKREQGWMHIDATYSIYFNEKNGTFYQIIEHLSKGVQLLTEIGDKVGVAAAWRSLGTYAVTKRMPKLVVHSNVNSFRIGVEIGDLVLQCNSLNMIGAVQLNKGRPAIAERMFKMVLFGEATIFDSETTIEPILDWLGGAALALGHKRRSVILLSAGDALRKRWVGKPEDELNEIWKLKFQKMASEGVEETLFNQAWAEGQDMSYDEIVSFALEDEDPSSIKILL